MYPVPQQTPPPPTYDAMPPVTPPAMPPSIPPVQPSMQAPVQAPKEPNNADLENGPDGEDLNVPKNIKEIKG